MSSNGLQYLLDRLGEASTWRGLIAMLTSFGVFLLPEQVEAIVAGGLAGIGIIGAFFKDKNPVEK